MESLEVGSNLSIKLKVELQTEAIPSTCAFLYHDINDELPYHNIKPYNPAMQTGWKTLNKENPIYNKKLMISTILRFFNSFPNEETFNLAIQQVKDSYSVKIKGGNPSPFETNFVLQSFYESKLCIIESKLKLS